MRSCWLMEIDEDESRVRQMRRGAHYRAYLSPYSQEL